MNRLITSEPTLTNGQPLTNDSIPFIEDGIQEAISNLVKGLLGSYTTGDVIILFGCEVTFPGSLPGTASITAGAIFYNGEVYTVQADASISVGTGETVLFTNSEANGPLVLFEDNTDHYPHRIRQIQAVAGVAGGSGVDDYITEYDDASVINLSQTFIETVNNNYSSGVTDGTNNIKTKIVDIGVWNMNATSFLLIPFPSGVTHANIRRLHCRILADDPDAASHSLETKVASYTQGTVADTSMGIYLERGTLFSSTGWTSTSINRGYLYIDYVE